jgi:tetratricopeptide (TPR) repeat protein
VRPSASIRAWRPRAFISASRSSGRGELREALTAYIQSLRLEPRLLEARYGLSSVTAALGDLDGAVTLLQQVVTSTAGARRGALQPRHPISGTAAGRSGRPGAARDVEAALEALRTAVRLAPDQARFHAALGEVLAQRQDLDGSVASFRRARALEPGRAEHAYNLGLALRLAGDLDAAEAELRAAIARDPEHGLARRALGLVLRTRADLPAAASELRAAVAALPDDAQAHHLLGSLLLALDARSEGLDILRRAIELDPALVEAHVTLAQALARAGDRDAARRQQDEVQRINTDRAAFGQAMVLVDSATRLLDDGDQRGAIALLRDAIDLSPAFSEAHYRLGLALMSPFEAAGHRLVGVDADTAAAIEAALRRAVVLDPEDARAYLALGRLHVSRGDHGPGLVALRRACAIAPGLTEAQRALAALAAARRDWATAIPALEAIVAWHPQDDAAALALARSLLQQADWAGAAAAFRHVTQLQPEHADAYYGLADALKGQGRLDEAARALATARRLDTSSGARR